MVISQALVEMQVCLFGYSFQKKSSVHDTQFTNSGNMAILHGFELA